MKTICSVFPTAKFSINESEVELYREAIPSGHDVSVHPDMPLPQTVNWILDNYKEECILIFSDEIEYVLRVCPPQKRIRDPGTILQIVENSWRVAMDCDIGVFSWTINTNYTLLRPYVRPIRSCGPCSGHAIGIRGPARERRFNPNFIRCADYDFTLESILQDRAVMLDVRYHFASGKMTAGGRGGGGSSGLFTNEQYISARKALSEKWGRYVSSGSSKTGKFTAERGDYAGMSVRVERLSNLAAK